MILVSLPLSYHQRLSLTYTDSLVGQSVPLQIYAQMGISDANLTHLLVHHVTNTTVTHIPTTTTSTSPSFTIPSNSSKVS